MFDFPNLYSGTETLIAVYAYALQIYYDFSGYTDIAIGSALLLGIKLPQNFNRSLRGRKHRRFLAPLAHHAIQLAARLSVFFAARQANRKSFSYVNLFITMVIGGLWHGASWKFVIWGALHGLGLAVVQIVADAKRERRRATGVWRLRQHFRDVPIRRFRLDFLPRVELRKRAC